MKLATAWWGCQLLAETAEEESALRLVLSAQTTHAYEYGNDEHISEVKYDEREVYSFTEEEFKSARLVIEIRR